MNNLSSYIVLILSVLIIFTVVGIPNYKQIEYIESKPKQHLETDTSGTPVVPSSMLMYELLETYSQKHNVPRYIAYNIAFRETRYRGPFDWDYNPELISPVGAQGPMQVMPSTAKLIQGKVVDKEELRTNLELNIQTSMMLLEKLYNKYGDWKIVCGCYNTGQPIVNEYAVYCSNNKDYRGKWVYYK